MSTSHRRGDQRRAGAATATTAYVLVVLFTFLPCVGAGAQTFVNSSLLRRQVRESAALGRAAGVQSAEAVLDTTRARAAVAVMRVAPADRAAADSAAAAALATLWRDAARAPSQNPRGFDAAVDLTLREPAAAARLVQLELAGRGDAPPSPDVAVALAALATDSARFAEELTRVPSGAVDAVRAYGALLQAALASVRARLADTPVITLLALGDVKGLKKGEISEDDFSGTGSLGVGYATARYVLQATINVASSLDSLTDDYAAVVLTPNLGKGLSSAQVTWRGLVDGGRMTLTFYSGVSSALWRKGERRSSVVVVPAGVLWEVAKRGAPTTEGGVEIRLDAGVSARAIAGDLSTNREARADFLGQTRRVFWGPELGLQITFARIVASGQYYHYLARRSAHAPGITRGQFVAGISLAGELLTLRVPKGNAGTP